MKIFDRGVILPPPLNFLHSLKIFDKGLILPPPLNFYIHVRSSKGFDDDDDDDDALPVLFAVPGKAQAFAVELFT